jgi:hypothetical protein
MGKIVRWFALKPDLNHLFVSEKNQQRQKGEKIR